jgi:hypothetical protein
MTRIYPVRDLYRGPLRAEGQPIDDKGTAGRPATEQRRGDLERAIAKTIEPDSWEEQNGPGSMTYVHEAGSLVIRQTAATHEQILQLLRDLRDAKRVGQGAPRQQASPKAGWKLRGPKRAEVYSFVGLIDLDGDGTGNSDRLHELLKIIGSSIDNEVDEKGVLRIDGEIPDDGRPCITEKTKFVVVGTIPEFANSPDPEEIYTSLKIAGFYKDIEDQARAKGVRIIKLADFLRYIGYEN